jgi:hypothetical protein
MFAGLQLLIVSKLAAQMARTQAGAFRSRFSGTILRSAAPRNEEQKLQNASHCDFDI